MVAFHSRLDSPKLGHCFVTRKRDDSGIDTHHPALSPTRPLFIDNREGNTLDRALLQHLRTLRREMALPWEVCIASAFFNVSGFRLLAPELEQMGHVRLLLGAEPRPEAARKERQPGDPPEPDFISKQVRDALKEQDDGLTRARDLLPFDADTDAAVRRLLEFLHARTGDSRPKFEVKRYEDQFLHAKAFVFRVKGGGTVVGSSNLTYGGLRRNLELNLGHYEDPVVGKVENWFDELWAKAVPYDLAAIFDRLMEEYPPYLIYLRVLYALYGVELDQEEQEMKAAGEIPLTTFQKHGVWRALRILKRYGGVLVADGVGLGKTYLAGEIIRRYRERRQRVLLICPAALRDSTWKRFLDEFELFVDCFSYEQLAADRRLNPKSDRETLKYPPEDYALVIADEAHNYRNPRSESRVPAFRQLLMGQRRDLVLLSATPVNNSLWDMYYALRFFLKQDAAFTDRGILSIKERFQEAEDADPFALDPDLLYPIIDGTTVKRTRRFIKKHYTNDLIDLPDGRRVPVQFPKPQAITINYDLDAVLPGFIDKLEACLAPEDGHPLIHMARYRVEEYVKERIDDMTREPQVVGFLRSAMLKRFESSVHAFVLTVQRIVSHHDLFLKALDRGVVLKSKALEELSASEDEEEFDEVLERHGAESRVEDYEVERLRQDVENDRRLLAELAAEASKVRPLDDPKLERLAGELADIILSAKREAIDEEDCRRKRKVLVFSAFTETIDWVEEFLESRFLRDRSLAAYEGRMASVAGDESRHHVTRDQAIRGFSPESVVVNRTEGEDRYDLLLSTDVLAEGMNLQQCRNVINYDLPWNPMRLVQRHGRIDRIGSPHSHLFLRTFFPDLQLDRLLKLEDRVRRKLAKAAASVGVEETPIEHGAVGLQSFTETREEIERLQRGDASIYESGGTASAAQTGEEYRQELRKALQTGQDEIESLAWKAGSGLAKGSQRGHFFCATVGERVYLRFVPIGTSEPAQQIVSEIGTCLRMIECQEDTPRVMPLDLKQTAFSAWQRARQHIYDSWTHETDPANLQPKVSKLNREIAEFLRQYPPGDVEQVRLERCLDAIEAPCSRREENQLRAVFEAEFQSHDAKSKAVLEEVERIGLEPFQAPPPLPPISADDVHLICWLAVELADNAR